MTCYKEENMKKTVPAGKPAEKKRVYCGPSVRGVAKQFTVYTGELPEDLR